MDGCRYLSAYNKVWNIKTKLVNSEVECLYPYATIMRRLHPAAHKEVNNCNYDFLQKQRYYLVIISIIKVDKHREFLLIVENDDIDFDNFRENTRQLK